MTSIAAVLAVRDEAQAADRLQQLVDSPLVHRIAVAAPEDASISLAAVHRLRAETLQSAAGAVEVLRWLESTDASHLLWLLSSRVKLTEGGLRRLAHAAADTQAAITYSDYFDEQQDGTVSPHPLIDYQSGSIRDDFDYGHVVLLSRTAMGGLAEAIEADRVASTFGGWYDLRLRASERGPVVHLCEPTYCAAGVDPLANEAAHFNYVDPRNREYQIEMERIATSHLQRIRAWLPSPNERFVDDNTCFSVESSVVIPVRNRVRTIGDAVRSALHQEADFPFNVIVVDNHSTDGTSQALTELATKDPRLVHLIPARRDLGIGGCWNEAIYSASCGRYAMQLDSDDLYASSEVLARIVAEFRREPYAAVIGSYTIVDSDLQQIPPGLIDHREWTRENGHNNAFRIAGLGALAPSMCRHYVQSASPT